MDEIDDPHTRSEHPAHWRIPANNTNLRFLLQSYGFETDYVGNLRYIRVDNTFRVYLGQVNSSEADRLVTITYAPAEMAIEQWKACIKLRQVLEENHISFDEKPPREEVIARLERESKDIASVIKMLKGEESEND